MRPGTQDLKLIQEIVGDGDRLVALAGHPLDLGPQGVGELLESIDLGLGADQADAEVRGHVGMHLPDSGVHHRGTLSILGRALGGPDAGSLDALVQCGPERRNAEADAELEVAGDAVGGRHDGLLGLVVGGDPVIL